MCYLALMATEKRDGLTRLVPLHRGFDGLRGSEDWQRLGQDEKFDAAGEARLATDQAEAFEGEQHLVDAGRGDLEVPFHVGFGRWTSVDLGVGPDEGEVLALFLGEARRRPPPVVKQLIHC